MKKILFLIITTVFFVGLADYHVKADDTTPAVSIPITQTVTEGVKEKAEVDYTLTSCDEHAPVPEGTENDRYTFTVRGTDIYDIPEIKISQPGKWNYILRAEGRNSEILSEKTRYITVFYDGSTEDAKVLVTAYQSDGKKCDLNFNVRPKTGKNDDEQGEPIEQETPTDPDVGPDAGKVLAPPGLPGVINENQLFVVLAPPGIPPETAKKDRNTQGIVKTGDDNKAYAYIITLMTGALLIIFLAMSKKNDKSYR